MTILKCQTCGGELELKHGTTIGTCKYCGSKHAMTPAPRAGNAASNSAPADQSELDRLLKRIAMLIEDRDYNSADEYCSKALDENPDCVAAYFFRLVLDFKQNRDCKPYARRLEAATPEPVAEEADFIAARPLDCCLAYIKGGAANRLRYILALHPDLIKANVPNDRNPVFPLLSFAVIFASDTPEIIKTLLECGANVNSCRIYKNRYRGNKYPALSDATWNVKSIAITALLLDHGANPNTVDAFVDDEGGYAVKSMLTNAIVDARSPEMVELLLKRGATWNTKIRYAGIVKKEQLYPFHKSANLSADFLAFLKEKGWRGYTDEYAKTRVTNLIRWSVATLVLLAGWSFFRGYETCIKDLQWLFSLLLPKF